MKSMKVARLTALFLALIMLFGVFIPITQAAGDSVVVSGDTLIKKDGSGKTIATKKLSVGNIYTLVESQSRFTNAQDAADGKNAVGSRTAGTYYIYKIYNGIYNLSYVKGQPGSWVDLRDSQRNLLAQKGYVSKVVTPPVRDDYDFQGFVNSKSGVNVRKAVSGSLVGRLRFKDIVKGQVTDDGNWIEFTYNGKTAYVHKMYVRQTSSLPGKAVDAYISDRFGVNIRKMPSGSKLGELDYKDVIEGRFVYNGKWFEFYYKDSIAYVHSDYIRLGQPSSSIYVKGFISGNAVNVRSSVNGTIMKQLPYGSYIEGKLVSNGNWIEFSHYGETRYVHSSLFEELETESGWVNKGNFRYYIAGSSSKPLRGFSVIGGKQYYFDPMMRYMYKSGVKNTSRSIYYFNSSGVLTAGTRTIKGTTHSMTFNFGKPNSDERANKYLTINQRDHLGQAAVNEALKAIGTKYYWYGTSLTTGNYCSGLAYRAYKNVGLTIPGPEYGNEETARTKGPQSGNIKRGWGEANDYGYEMVTAQYNLTDDYTGGSRLALNGNFNNLQAGDLFFARNPQKSYLTATHTAMYAGLFNGVHYTMHSGFAGNRLEPITTITNGWGYPLKAYFQRPFK